jgi:hypothetical protein
VTGAPSTAAVLATPFQQGDNATGGLFYGDPPGGGTLQDPLVVVLLVVVGTVAVVAVERRAGGSVRLDDGGDGGDDGDDPAAARRRAVGEAVGRAADSLAADAADTEAEAFRAWADLAAELGIESPETADAETLCERAVGAGLAEDDADALAEQFEVLRYGGAATDRREREAVAALRAIEAEYAGDGGDGDDGDDDGSPATAADA